MNNISHIITASYSTSKEADQIGKEFKKRLGCENNYEVARLAIGRSLNILSQPSSAPDSKGQALRGMQLFGQENDANYLWIALLCEQLRLNCEASFNLEAFQKLIRDHWHRGALLLEKDWQEAGKDFSAFLEILASKAELTENFNKSIQSREWEENINSSSGNSVDIYLGEIEENNQPFKWRINGTGYSPHIAIMGQAGSGKTRAMLNIITQISNQNKAPVLLLDLGKGELSENHSLAESINANILRVPESPIPLDMFYGSTRSEDDASDAVMGFRDSFAKVMQSRPGSKQLDAIRTALKPLFSKNEKINLNDIRNCLQLYYNENAIKIDSVISTLNDLIERQIFQPTLSPTDFFNQSWIITFGNARDTIKNLSAYMLLDSLHNYLKGNSESPIDSEGNRKIRIVLAIDEAKHLLASNHSTLSNCIRLHRSKGLVVALSSQSPDDYDGASDDYLENIGLPICFKTNAKSTQVLQNMFKAKVSFSSLKTGTCLTLNNGKSTKVKVF